LSQSHGPMRSAAYLLHVHVAPRPIALANLVAFLASGCWGFVADVLGRRWAMIIPATIGLFITPLYLFVDSYPLLAGPPPCKRSLSSWRSRTATVCATAS
jgi:MFS-type transporter involved in bile tolerance (Atg22 family)